MIEINNGLHAARVEIYDDGTETGNKMLDLQFFADDGEEHHFCMQPADAHKLGLELLAQFNRVAV